MLIKRSFLGDANDCEAERWRAYGRRKQLHREPPRDDLVGWKEASLTADQSVGLEEVRPAVGLLYVSPRLTRVQARQLGWNVNEKEWPVVYHYEVYGRDVNRIKVTSLLESQLRKGGPIIWDPTGYFNPWKKSVSRRWMLTRPAELWGDPDVKGWVVLRQHIDRRDIVWSWCPSFHERRIANICKHDDELISYCWEQIAASKPGPCGKSPHAPVPSFRIRQWCAQWLRDRKKQLKTISIDIPMGKDGESNSDTQALAIVYAQRRDLGHYYSSPLFHQGDENGSGIEYTGAAPCVDDTRLQFVLNGIRNGPSLSRGPDTWNAIARSSLRVFGKRAIRWQSFAITIARGGMRQRWEESMFIPPVCFRMTSADFARVMKIVSGRLGTRPTLNIVGGVVDENAC